MWCDTAHQEPAKVTVLQSVCYSCEKIPWHFLNKSRVLVPVFWLASIFQCISSNHQYFFYISNIKLFQGYIIHINIFLIHLSDMATQTILGVYEILQAKLCLPLSYSRSAIRSFLPRSHYPVHKNQCFYETELNSRQTNK